MSDSKDFCCADDLSVLIPYKKLEKLLKAATNSTEQEKRIKHLEEKLGSLHGLYSELLEKVAELQESL